jgi:hypothetical protein
MVNFRRVITVLAVLALFTGLGFAQQESCTAQGAVSTPLRAEGFTEQTGDILIQCTGGLPIGPGLNIPLANFTVFFNTAVTSRLFASGGLSEALLLVDEPGLGYDPLTGLPDPNKSYGSKLPLIPCNNYLTGCIQTVGAVAGSTFNTAVSSAATPGPNAFSGIVSGNSVTFYGVPILPPTTLGSRTYRITNIRVNAQSLAGGSASGASPVQASIVLGGPGALPILNSAPVVGYVSTGLTATASGPTSLQQCNTQTRTYASLLTFTEGFGTAFKTRVFASNNSLYAGQIGVLNQNTVAGVAPPAGNQSLPGGVYYSESNFVYNINGGVAGLADFGTRLKATFNNVPTGVRIFVSTANVYNGGSPVPVPGGGANIGGNAANATSVNSFTGYALLVNGETTSDGTSAPGAGFFPSLSSSDNYAGVTAVGITEVPIAANTGTAVWEVLNTSPTTQESFNFAVYTTYVAATATNTPLPGTSTVNLSFAPTATSGVASTSLPIPRFAGDSVAARNFLTIGICRTILLYPYITNQGGFDTGLTVANTSQDPFTTGSNATAAQAGACTFTYYGGTTAAPTTPPGPTSTGSIAAGTVWANTLGSIAPNFQGYAFAICNFQFAHGFAFISDVGARNLAMGYLALVIPDTTGKRTATPGGCNGVAGCASSGEQDAH